jgi:hypothetical protein
MKVLIHLVLAALVLVVPIGAAQSQGALQDLGRMATLVSPKGDTLQIEAAGTDRIADTVLTAIIEEAKNRGWKLNYDKHHGTTCTAQLESIRIEIECSLPGSKIRYFSSLSLACGATVLDKVGEFKAKLIALAPKA